MKLVSLVIAAAQSASLAGDVPGNVSRHLRCGEIAAERGVRLLVFPELSLIGYELELAGEHVIHPDSSELDPLRRLARDACMTIVAGGPLPGEAGALHIGALAFRPDGTVSTYTKEHVHASEEHVFTSGPGGALLTIEQTSVALAICADASHPSHAAKAAAAGADVYAVGVMITEDAYARKTGLLAGYAREHKMAVVMANYSGVTGGEASAGKSAIWSEDGRVVAKSQGTDEELIIAERRAAGWAGAIVTVPVTLRL